MGVDDVVAPPAGQPRQRAHIGDPRPLLRKDKHVFYALGANLLKQIRLNRVGRDKVDLDARARKRLGALQGEHDDAVARDGHREHVQRAHQSRASRGTQPSRTRPSRKAS